MGASIHGTRSDPAKQHPVLDIRHWENEFPLGDNRRDGSWIDRAGELAVREQSIQMAKTKGDLGPSVASDVFVWSHCVDQDKPWLTRIGGKPWRENKKPWPKDEKGVPLHFLGQICFADSKDILPYKLPGEVALIFGRWQRGWATLVEGSAIEWSTLKLKEPLYWSPGYTSEIPFERQGVIHRTVQYTDWGASEPSFKAAGWNKGGSGVSSIQATLIGAYSDLPQGWPFEKNDGRTLIAVLSSSYFNGKWPTVDVPCLPSTVGVEGKDSGHMSMSALDFGIGDAGAVWIYRDRKGKFHLDEAC